MSPASNYHKLNQQMDDDILISQAMIAECFLHSSCHHIPRSMHKMVSPNFHHCFTCSQKPAAEHSLSEQCHTLIVFVTAYAARDKMYCDEAAPHGACNS
jgi:hypothetical protein